MGQLSHALYSTPAESRHLDFCLGPSRLLPNRRPSCVRCMCVTFAHFFLYQVCVCVRTFRCLRISYYELCLLFRVKSRARRRQLGWKLTRGYGCWRGVAAGAAPGTCYSLHPLAPSGGARIDTYNFEGKMRTPPSLYFILDNNNHGCGTPVLHLPQKKMLRRFFEQIYDRKHLYLCIFLVYVYSTFRNSAITSATTLLRRCTTRRWTLR